jgi:hypothetical protein
MDNQVSATGRLPPLARKIWMTAYSLNRPVAVDSSTSSLKWPFKTDSSRSVFSRQRLKPTHCGQATF